jgi:hypothetical protein
MLRLAVLLDRQHLRRHTPPPAIIRPRHPLRYLSNNQLQPQVLAGGVESGADVAREGHGGQHVLPA